MAAAAAAVPVKDSTREMELKNQKKLIIVPGGIRFLLGSKKKVPVEGEIDSDTNPKKESDSDSEYKGATTTTEELSTGESDVATEELDSDTETDSDATYSTAEESKVEADEISELKKRLRPQNEALNYEESDAESDEARKNKKKLKKTREIEPRSKIDSGTVEDSDVQRMKLRPLGGKKVTYYESDLDDLPEELQSDKSSDADQSEPSLAEADPKAEDSDVENMNLGKRKPVNYEGESSTAEGKNEKSLEADPIEPLFAETDPNETSLGAEDNNETSSEEDTAVGNKHSLEYILRN